ncbi:methyl-accepting chemotaxis protein [Bradyrhizobium sp. USDA 4503]
MMFGLRISTKLLIMAGLSILGIATVAVVSLSTLRDALLEDRKSKLHDVVLLARQAIEADYQVSKKDGLPDQEALERGRALLRTLRFGQDDYFYALSSEGVVLAHPNRNVEGKDLYNAPDSNGVFYARDQVLSASKGGGFVAYRFPRASGTEPQPKISYAVVFKPYNWTIGGGIYLDDVDAIFQRQLWWIGAIVLVTLSLILSMSLVLGRSIVVPIRGMTAAMRGIAAGDTATVVPAQERRDEVGAMAQSVQVFKESMIEASRLRSEQDELKSRTEAEKHEFLDRMAGDFEQSVRGSLDVLSGAATELRETSGSMSSTADAATKQATTVAAVAEQASSNVAMVAAATEELASSVAEIGRQVAESARVAGRAVEEAHRTNATVEGLSAAAQKIGNVISLISDIAGQTNLLALNATIEAARAGEAGRGFAVVASEVKLLASQTARATEDISAQVIAMQGATSEAVQAIERIGGTIGTINEIATLIAAAVEQQGSATKEIARNIQQAAHGTGTVSGNIIGVTQAASLTGAAAERVLVSAEELNQQADGLRTKVDHFLSSIRAA